MNSFTLFTLSLLHIELPVTSSLSLTRAPQPFYFITSFTYYTGLGTLQCLHALIRYVMSSRPDIHIQASSLTPHCDIFHFDIISSLFPASHITTCDIRSLSFLLSLFTRHYPCFTLSGGFLHIIAWRIVAFFPPIHPMGNGLKISV